MSSLPGNGVEVVPRLWIGSPATCDAARSRPSFTCVSVATKPHTNDSRCACIPIFGADGRVDFNQFAKIRNLTAGKWPQYGNVLVHCSDGLSGSPLTAALLIQQNYNVPLSQAYSWVKAQQPGVRDMSKLALPLAHVVGG